MEQTNNRPLEIEVFNPIKGSYIVRYDYNYIEPTEENPQGQWTYKEIIYDKKPNLEELKTMIIDHCNKQCDREIVQDFYFEGNQVWLATENAFNYKATWDLAHQTKGSTLPTTFKFGSSDKPIYREFTTLEDLEDFYIKALFHIDKTLQKYWKIKDSIDWSKYEIE